MTLLQMSAQCLSDPLLKSAQYSSQTTTTVDSLSPPYPWCLNWPACQLWLLVVVSTPTLTLFCACGSGSIAGHLVDWRHSYNRHVYSDNSCMGSGRHSELAMSDYISVTYYAGYRDIQVAVVYVPGQTCHLDWWLAKFPANWTGFNTLQRLHIILFFKEK